MNEALFQYVAESAVCLLLFYLFYTLVLQRETCLQLNRFYLLGAIVLSFVMPLSNLPGIDLWSATPEPERTVAAPVVYEMPMVQEAYVVEAPIAEPFNYWNLLYGAYGLGVLFFASKLFIQLWRLSRFARQQPATIYLANQVPVIFTDGHYPTFSFWRWVFFDNSQELTLQETRHILQHEEVHLNQRHTFDILLVSIIGIFFWFNPLLLLFKKALEQAHEFIADAEVAKSSDSDAYSSLLVKQVFQNSDFALGSHFFFSKSLTLTRIKMIKKLHQSPKLSRLLLLIPVMALLVTAVAAMRPVEEPSTQLTPEESRTGDAPAEFTLNNGDFGKYIVDRVVLPEVMFQKKKSGEEMYFDFEYEYEIDALGKVKFLNTLNLKTSPQNPEVRAAVKSMMVKLVNNAPTFRPALKDGKPVAAVKKGGLSISLGKSDQSYSQYLKVHTKRVQLLETTQPAQFPGGREAVNNFVRSQFMFPKVAFDRLSGNERNVQVVATLEVEINARGVASFSRIINLEASPSHAEVTKALENEFGRVIGLMPGWSPALKEGQPVASKEIIKIASISSDFLSYDQYARGQQQKTKVTSTTVNGTPAPGQNDPLKEITVVGQPSSEEYAVLPAYISEFVIVHYPPQHLSRPKESSQNASEAIKKPLEAYVGVQKMPEFKGGYRGFMKTVANSIRIPKADSEIGVEGLVIGSFMVSPEGKVTKVEIVKSLSPTLDQELVRVLSSLPDFKPGMDNGKAVAVTYRVPVRIEAKFAEKKEAPALNEITVEGRPAASAEEKIFIAVEKMPEFPGGQAAMFKYLKDKMPYPEDAKAANVEGVLVASFVVSPEGKIKDVTLLKKLHPSLDQIFIKTLENMPTWSPGMQNGKTVSVKYTIPFRVVAENAAAGTNEPAYNKELDAYTRVDQMPEFPGGQLAMFKYLGENFKIPAEDAAKNLSGSIIASFIVTKEGKVKDVKILRGISSSLDQEAIRVLSAMPTWRPGMHNGKPVNVSMAIPYRIELKESTKK